VWDRLRIPSHKVYPAVAGILKPHIAFASEDPAALFTRQLERLANVVKQM
jgi:hypothetical protein